MIGTTVQRLPTLIPLVALMLAGVLLAGCGAASLRDQETAVDAQAAQTPDDMTSVSDSQPVAAEPAPPSEPAASTETVQAAPSADNPAAWSTVQAGAQTFAGRLDQANQSVASCQTDAAAGRDFDTCIGEAYTTISAAAGELATTVDGTIGQTDGVCRAALSTLREAAQAMIDDYARAVVTTDLTSRETLDLRLAEDTRAYADETIAAAAACSG
jgi:hypothetical protein